MIDADQYGQMVEHNKTVELNTPQMIDYLRTDAHPQFTIWRFSAGSHSLTLVQQTRDLPHGLVTLFSILMTMNVSTWTEAIQSTCLDSSLPRSTIYLSSPFALRFSIEGKGYSLMVMLIAADFYVKLSYKQEEISIQKNLLSGNVYILPAHH